MYSALGYSSSIFETFSIAENLVGLGFGSDCVQISCEAKCVNCRDGCNQGPDPNPKPDEPVG